MFRAAIAASSVKEGYAATGVVVDAAINGGTTAAAAVSAPAFSIIADGSVGTTKGITIV